MCNYFPILEVKVRIVLSYYKSVRKNSYLFLLLVVNSNFFTGKFTIHRKT